MGSTGVNIKLIAERTGVSTATVSRVLNGKSNVKAETREKILREMRKSGYDKKIYLQNCQLLHSNTVLVVLQAIHRPFLHDLFYYFQEYSKDYPYEILYYSTAGEDIDYERIERLAETAQGIIFFSSNLSDAGMMQRLYEKKYPVVVIDNYFPDIPVCTLRVNNRRAAQSVVDYLAALNHKKIACLAGSPNLRVWSDRVNGYIQAMQKKNFFIYKDYIQYCDTEDDGVEEAAEKFLAMRPKERPTAIFCFNDAVAYKLITCIQAYGFAVPDDISVVGFDYQEYVPRKYHGPVLTSVKQPFKELVSDSLQLLEEQIKGIKIEKNIDKVYETTLYEGESTIHLNE